MTGRGSCARHVVSFTMRTLSSLSGVFLNKTAGYCCVNGISSPGKANGHCLQGILKTMKQGALRETLEEANAQVEIIAPYRLFDLPFISQIYLMFRAKLLTVDFSPTAESSQIQFFTEAQIPWDKIAFQVIKATLKHYIKDRNCGKFEFQQFELQKTDPPVIASPPL
jgi:hypothetical protein